MLTSVLRQCVAKHMQDMQPKHLQTGALNSSTFAYVSIRQRMRVQQTCNRNTCKPGRSAAALPHTLAYVSIRQHTSAYVSIRQHMRVQQAAYAECVLQNTCKAELNSSTSAYVSIRQHTSAYVSIRQHTSAYATCDVATAVQLQAWRPPKMSGAVQHCPSHSSTSASCLSL